jgi:hypothetical protein
MTNGNGLNKKAVLVSLNEGMWSAKKYDQKASNKTEKAHGAKHGVARVNKQLVAKEVIGNVLNKYGAVRAFFKTTTRPWLRGIGILKNSAYEEFIKGITPLILEAEKAADELIPIYPDLYEQSKIDLAEMWNADDYPHPSKIRGKFYIKYRFMPVPDTGDFRVEGLGKESSEEIRKNIEDSIKEGLAESMKVTYQELAKYISNMIEKLDDGPKSRKNSKGHQTFRDSLVDNIKNLVERLPKLNINDDPELYKLGQDIAEKLCKFDAEELRDDKKLRKEIRNRAQEALKNIEGYF